MLVKMLLPQPWCRRPKLLPLRKRENPPGKFFQDLTCLGAKTLGLEVHFIRLYTGYTALVASENILQYTFVRLLEHLDALKLFRNRTCTSAVHLH